jgi:hypothetical protein
MRCRLQYGLLILCIVVCNGIVHAITWVENKGSFLTGELKNCQLDAQQEIKLQTQPEAQTALLYKDQFQDGKSEDWDVVSGSWEVSMSGIYYGLYCAGSRGDSWAARSLVAGGKDWKEYTVRAKVRATKNSWIGLIISQNDNGYYMVQLSVGSNKYRVYKSNPSRTLGEWQDARTVFKPNTWYTVEATIREDTLGQIDFRILDQYEIVLNPNTSVKDSDSPYPGGRVGLITIETPAYFSNMTVEVKGRKLFAADGSYTSMVLDTGSNNQAWDFVGWVSEEIGESKIQLALRASDQLFSTTAKEPAWQQVTNFQQKGLPQGRYVQYRATLLAGLGRIYSPNLIEVLLSSDKRLLVPDGKPRPKLQDLTMSMMYSTTMRKLHVLYSQTNYNASERGVYILRNQLNQPITAESYVYQPGAEDYLTARYGTWILVRVHPIAAHSPLTLSAQTILMDKQRNTQLGSQGPTNAINFFDEDFMTEYLTGVKKMVEYDRDHNQHVLGYTIMPPEFFYDCVPYPIGMKWLGGFGQQAKESYLRFLRRVGSDGNDWPEFSDGGISLNRDYYLWAYWRNMEAARYIGRVAAAIKEVDPKTMVGTLHYVVDLQLRGLEPGFIEKNPQVDYYYSSNGFPRIPGPDGYTGGHIITNTRQNVLGHSNKVNLVEHDLWSPYIDFKRHDIYEKYAYLQKILPIPIVFGNFPEGDPPSNHLTKYNGMTGEPITLELMKTLECSLEKNRKYLNTENVNHVAFIFPSFSLYSILERGSWKVNRYQYLTFWPLDYLVKQSVGFDLLTEGYADTEVLDKYKLVIVVSPVIYPWLRNALENTTADVLALGWAGSVAAPGPNTLKIDPDPKEMVLTLEHAWPENGEVVGTGKTIFPTEGKVIQEDTAFCFAQEDHPLLKNLAGLELNYKGLGIGGAALPYVGELEGETLAVDEQGRAVYAVQERNGKKVIHFGGLLHFSDRDGNDASLFSKEQEIQFFNNIMDYCGITYYPDLEPIRIFETSKYVLIENTSDQKFVGEVPNKLQVKGLKWPDYTAKVIRGLEIPPFSSIVIELDER